MKKYISILFVAFAILACKKEDGGTTPVKPDPKPSDATVSGCITGNDGRKLAGVVVSDGFICTQTDAEGNYYLNSTLDGVDYVIVSTPSGYSAPVTDALPVYYKRLDELVKTDGKYVNVNFTLEKIADPNRFSVFFSGDPQPRSSGAGYDKFAYHSLDCVDDMCRDFRETAAEIIKDHPVYGVILGDVCHNSTALFPTHRTKMSNNGFPTYHVIGNHDHDLAADGDREAAKAFEKVLGPSNYSFNLGDLHFIVLDNMMVVSGPNRASNSGSDLSDGLRDDIYQWMENDLEYVDKSRTLVICTHSPMFMCMGQSMRTRSTIAFDGKKISSHYSDVDNLIKPYAKVYAWAGHTHATYNYVDTENPPYVESHTVVRVTGELWTNEYVSSGTPRGYVIMNYDNGDISWKFHPIKYQSGNNQAAKVPAYKYRDWNYEGGVAKMKATGKDLDESYQMHVYPPGTYAANDGLIYANIFLWDNLWKDPYFTYDGVRTKMKRYTANKYRYYDFSCYEIQSWYSVNNSTLATADYNVSKSNTSTVFTASVQTKHPEGKNSGTVSVEDRFGNTYSSTIIW